MKKYLTYKDDRVYDFCRIETSEKSLTVVQGKNGTEGTEEIKTFVSEDECLSEAEKILMEKRNMGYQPALNLPYFHAEVADVSCHSDNEVACSFCGNKDYCIDLSELYHHENIYFRKYHFTHTNQKEVDMHESVPDTFGCMDCLRAGKFELLHVLEEESKLLLKNALFIRDPYGTRESHPGDWDEFDQFVQEITSIPLGNRNELMRTPVIWTTQSEDWLVHCNDFMQFVGIWRARDFVREGKEVGLSPAQMFDKICFDWSGEYENFVVNTDAGELVYVFKCRHCQLLRSNIDCF
jgi:predicted DNA-binding WGR domain protein